MEIVLRRKKINHPLQHTYNLYGFVNAISTAGWGGAQETKILMNLVRLMNCRLVTVNVTAEGQLLMFSLGNKIWAHTVRYTALRIFLETRPVFIWQAL